MAKILIVDDSSTIRKLLSVIVQRLGHTVIAEAKNGIEGYEMYEKYKPDIVTMDMEMPECDGLSALKQIIAKYPDAIVVMVTSISQKDDVIRSIQIGAKNYIVKPIDQKKVESVLNNLVGKFVRVEDTTSKSTTDSKAAQPTVENRENIIPFSVNCSMEINIFKNLDEELLNQIDDSIQDVLEIKQSLITLKIHIPEPEIDKTNLKKILTLVKDKTEKINIEYIK